MESRQHQIFPSLTQDQFTALQRYGVRHISMFVVLAGTIEIARGSAIETHVIGTHGPDRLDGRSVDVVMVGAGPGGLAAAVYAASEGVTAAVQSLHQPIALHPAL